MHVAGIALDAASRSPIVLLRDPAGRRQVPIWIDQAQAHNIMAGIQGDRPVRPLSHDLMVALLTAGSLSLERVIIHAIEDSTFRALLKLKAAQHDSSEDNRPENNRPENNQTEPAEGTTPTVEGTDSEIEIDARPSDAIALAVRAGASIWMLEEVVAEASIPVDAEADSEEQDEFRRFLDQVSPAALVRHLQSRNPDGSEAETNDEASNDESDVDSDGDVKA